MYGREGLSFIVFEEWSVEWCDAARRDSDRGPILEAVGPLRPTVLLPREHAVPRRKG